MYSRLWVAAACIALTPGCYRGTDMDDGGSGSADGGADGGTGGSDGADSGDSGGDDGIPEQPESCEGDDLPLAIDMARLTRHEYEGTVRALFGDEAIDAVSGALLVIPDDVGNARIDRMSQNIGFAHVAGYFEAAEAIGEYYEGDAAARQALVPCLGGGDDSGCVRAFVEDFGARVYRRPLEGSEVDELVALFDAAAGDGAGVGMRQVLAAMLQAPSFVFHVEVGEAIEPDGSIELTDHELASRLSYRLWGLPPDDELRAAAADGSLATDDGLAAQVDRLLADGRAHDHLEHFGSQWLGLEDTRSFENAPDFRTQGLVLEGADDAARAELLAILRHVAWDEDGSYEDFLRTDLVVPSHPALAEVYGVAQGTEPVAIDDEGRVGLLSRLGFLGNPDGKSNPIIRGRRVSRDLLCVEMAPPDIGDFPDGAFDPLPPDGTRSTREEVEERTAPAACNGCHATFNDFGFALGDYDGLGRPRTTEVIFDDEGNVLGEVPIDANANLPLGNDVETNVNGAAEFAQSLGQSSAARECLSRRWLSYAAARETDSTDACPVDWQAETLAMPGGIRNMLRLLTTREQFRFRRHYEGE